jgi:hypothetical protein
VKRDGQGDYTAPQMLTVDASWLGRTLERAAQDMVDRTGRVALWEWDYTLWVCMRLANEMRTAGIEDPHERILGNHGIVVNRMREFFSESPNQLSAMQALLSGPLHPGYRPDRSEKGQNEIASDIQVFGGSMADAPASTYVELPFDGMPPVQALVEVKAPLGTSYRAIKYGKDVAKLAVSGEYYHRRFGHPRPYLGAWILDIKGHSRTSEGLDLFRRRLALATPGTEYVRVVVFRPSESPVVLQEGLAGSVTSS